MFRATAPQGEGTLPVACRAHGVLTTGSRPTWCAPISEAGSLVFVIVFTQAADQFAFQLKSGSERYAVFGILFSSDTVEFWICMRRGVEALPIADQGCRVEELWHFLCGDSIKNSTKR